MAQNFIRSLRTNATLRAALWMLGAVFSFSLMAVAAREAGRSHDTFETMLYRSLTGLLILLVWLVATGGLGRIGTGRPGLMLLRNAVHFSGQNLWLYALTLLPLAQVFALEFTAPIWVLLLGPLFLGERITGRGLIVAGLGFIGVLIVTRPGADTISPAVIAAALAAVAFALTNIATKVLTRTESVVAVLFWLHALQALMGLTAAGLDGVIGLPTAASLWPLIGVGVAGLTAHACLTTALSLAPAQRVMPVDFLRLPLIVAVGAWIYGEVVDPWVLIGGAVILGANWVNLARRTG